MNDLELLGQAVKHLNEKVLSKNNLNESIAFAWDNEGKERFTKTYPNRNYLTIDSLNERTLKINEWWVGIQEFNLTDYPEFLEYGITLSSKLIKSDNSYGIKPRITYYYMVNGKEVYDQATTETIIKDGEYMEQSFDFEKNLDYTRVTVGYNNTSPRTDDKLGGTAYNATVKEEKLELGTRATIYTTSPLTDLYNAYPQYFGLKRNENYVWIKLITDRNKSINIPNSDYSEIKELIESVKIRIKNLS